MGRTHIFTYGRFVPRVKQRLNDFGEKLHLKLYLTAPAVLLSLLLSKFTMIGIAQLIFRKTGTKLQEYGMGYCFS